MVARKSIRLQRPRNQKTNSIDKDRKVISTKEVGEITGVSPDPTPVTKEVVVDLKVEPKTPVIGEPAKPTITLPANILPRREMFIEHLVKKNHWTQGTELGIWKGRTFLHLLKTCSKLKMLGVDLWAPQPQNSGPENYMDWSHTENEKFVREQARPYGNRAIIYKMWTHEAVRLVPDASQDFIFIDADHSAESVRRDLEQWIPKLKPSGWIIGHDIDWDTVRVVVDEIVPGYMIGPDNVWFRPLNTETLVKI